MTITNISSSKKKKTKDINDSILKRLKQGAFFQDQSRSIFSYSKIVKDFKSVREIYGDENDSNGFTKEEKEEVD